MTTNRIERLLEGAQMPDYIKKVYSGSSAMTAADFEATLSSAKAHAVSCAVGNSANKRKAAAMNTLTRLQASGKQPEGNYKKVWNWARTLPKTRKSAQAALAAVGKIIASDDSSHEIEATIHEQSVCDDGDGDEISSNASSASAQAGEDGRQCQVSQVVE